MSGQHRPGEHSREIDVAALRAWIKLGRPGRGPRDWYYRTWPQKRHRRDSRPPWPWWPTVGAVALVIAVMFVLAAAGPIIEHVKEQRGEQRIARWCISCHGHIQLEGNR